MANCIITTQKGFVVDKTFDKVSRKQQVVFTNNLKDAKLFTKKSADTFLKSILNDEGFIYRPYKEETIKKYKVIKNYENVYVVITNFEIISDLNFLKHKNKVDKKEIFTQKEAYVEALKKNKELLKNLTKEIEEQERFLSVN